MTNANAVDVLVGVVMPLVIALINQRHWVPKLKALTAVVVCFLAATTTEAVRNGDTFNVSHWRTTIVLVSGAALASYHLWWKPSTWAATVEAIPTLPTGSGDR